MKFKIGFDQNTRAADLTQKIMFSFLYLLVFYSCIDNAKALFEQTDYDFGEIAADENISIVFRFSNSGNAPLMIQDIKANFGCTVQAWKEDKIMK